MAGRREYDYLRMQAQEARQNATQARAACTAAYAACARGEGAGPSEGQLAEADRLERLATKLDAELDALARNLIP